MLTMKLASSQSFALNPGIFTPRPRILRRFILAGILLIFSFVNLAEGRERAFPIPSGSQPMSIIQGPDGNFWFTLQDSSQVARITPDGVITEFRTPTFSFPFDIAAGPDGNVWFSEGDTGQIGFITPNGNPGSGFRPLTLHRESPLARTVTSGFVTSPVTISGAIPLRRRSCTNSLSRRRTRSPKILPDPMARFGLPKDSGKIGRITTNGVISEFGGGLHSPRSITSGPDGNVWFTLSFTPQLGRITPSGEITFFPAPNNPELLARGPGDTLLFSEFAANRIATISTTDGTVIESDEFRFAQPIGIVAGFKHDAWFLGFGDSKFIAPCCLVRRSKKPPAFRNRRVAWLCDSGHTFLARLPYGIQKVTTT